MALRFLFRYSQFGYLCKPTCSNRLTNKLLPRKGNFSNLQEKPKNKLFFISSRHNSTKKHGYVSPKYCSFKQLKNLKIKSVDEEDDSGDYYQKMDEINYGAYFSRKHNFCKLKKNYSKTRSTLDGIFKFCSQANNFNEMESYFDEMKHIDDDMKSSETITPSEIVVNIPQHDIQQILQDINLKIQNNIWKQSCPEIMNNLNCKNEMWKLIYGRRKGLKHEIMKNLSTSDLWKKFIQTQEPYVAEGSPLKMIK